MRIDIAPSRVTVLALVVLVAACSGQGPTPSSTATSGATAVPSEAAPPSAPPPASNPPASAPPPASLPPGAGPDLEAARVAVAPLLDGLGSAIWASGAGDGSGRLFVVEQSGRILIARDGAVLPTPFLDISGRVLAGGERGLLGVAFPPGFGADAPFVYVHYSGGTGETVLSEFRLTQDPDRADPDSERILLTEPQPYANHNGGWAGFDPSGMLLLALGDGGSGGDPENRASDLGSPLGKILRIDPSTPADGRAYGIPADNPFVGRAGVRPEILHSGLRNPFRAGYDPATGDLWIGDVGQNAWEEVDVARAGRSGLDFGWRRWEGLECFRPAAGCDPTGVTMPVAVYGHDLGCSVIGGVVYRGAAIPELFGAYVFSDYCSGTLWAIDAAGDAPRTPVLLLETGASISSVAATDDGEIVLADLRGGVLRLVPGG